MECVDCVLGDRTGMKNESIYLEFAQKKGQWLIFHRPGQFKGEIA